jgi:hypothetical protein
MMPVQPVALAGFIVKFDHDDPQHEQSLTITPTSGNPHVYLDCPGTKLPGTRHSPSQKVFESRELI